MTNDKLNRFQPVEVILSGKFMNYTDDGEGIRLTVNGCRPSFCDDANIPENDLSIVGLEVNRRWNMGGGRPSDAARSVEQERSTGIDCFGSPLRHSEAQVTKALQTLGWGS